ncbi:MAG: hypothetical protein K6U88_10900, partial [Dehalococcoidia bacterium]|nr:hypothetical protein [Dehalococcoidia bacterium]
LDVLMLITDLQLAYAGSGGGAGSAPPALTIARKHSMSIPFCGGCHAAGGILRETARPVNQYTL